jgi:nucleoid-associated protein YgaU
MFDSKSRYADCETAVMTEIKPDGTERDIHYVRRRFIASSEASTVVVEHSVKQGERLDNIAARYIGDPAQYWRICDVNNVTDPLELEEIGRTIKITIPGL